MLSQVAQLIVTSLALATSTKDFLPSTLVTTTSSGPWIQEAAVKLFLSCACSRTHLSNYLGTQAGYHCAHLGVRRPSLTTSDVAIAFKRSRSSVCLKFAGDGLDDGGESGSTFAAESIADSLSSATSIEFARRRLYQFLHV